MKLKHILQQIKHTLKWLPVIWNDRDFDYEYLLCLVKFKLQNMQVYFESDKPNVASASKTAKEIESALYHLDNYLNSDLYSVEFARFDIENDLNNGSFTDRIEKFSNLPESKKLEFVMLSEKHDVQKHNELCIFFDLLKDKLEGWWD